MCVISPFLSKNYGLNADFKFYCHRSGNHQTPLSSYKDLKLMVFISHVKIHSSPPRWTLTSSPLEYSAPFDSYKEVVHWPHDFHDVLRVLVRSGARIYLILTNLSLLGPRSITMSYSITNQIGPNRPRFYLQSSKTTSITFGRYRPRDATPVLA